MNNASISIKSIWTPDEKYTHHRIPGIFITSKGTVIIYNEARRDGSDWALMDIFLQRSEDHGETFGEPIYIAYGTEQYNTVNNPVMMEDSLGRLHLLYLRDYSIRGGGAWQRTSTDDGKTWSEPKEITDFTAPETHNAFAFGPGHGIRTKNGMLIVPIWMVLKTENAPIEQHWPSVLSTFCSKDNGENWFLGEIIGSSEDIDSPNETVAAETGDGRIVLYIRTRNCHFRTLAYGDSGFDGWSDMIPHSELIDPVCFGSIAKYENFGGKYALISANCASSTERKNVTVRISYDDGKTWSVTKTIDAERGGYVDIACDEKNGIIYLLYEDKGGSTSVMLAKMTPDWLTL